MLIAQIQLCFTKESLKPTFMSLFKRKPLGANLYIKMVPLSEISNNSEAETTNYLYELFKEKVSVKCFFRMLNSYIKKYLLG